MKGLVGGGWRFLPLPTESLVPMILLSHILWDRTSTLRRKWPWLIVPCSQSAGGGGGGWKRGNLHDGCVRLVLHIYSLGERVCVRSDASTYWKRASMCISTACFVPFVSKIAKKGSQRVSMIFNLAILSSLWPWTIFEILLLLQIKIGKFGICVAHQSNRYPVAS